MRLHLAVAVLLCVLGLGSCRRPPAAAPTVFLVGDSTMAPKEDRYRPETGWGEHLADYLTDGVAVENFARNGRSTKSFVAEGRWQLVMERVTAGDYVFVQFGHNDSKTASASYSTPAEYAANLRSFVAEVRGRGAYPVLLTPVVRRHFDADGRLERTHGDYPAAARRAARETGTPLIDITERSRALVAGLGDASSRELYLWLPPGQHPNYPEGVEDNTHFSPAGARAVAGLVAAGIRREKLPLRRYLRRKPVVP